MALTLAGKMRYEDRLSDTLGWVTAGTDCGYILLRHKFRPHPEERSEAARLEGWPQAPNLPPSFETGASQPSIRRLRLLWRPPQDEVVRLLTQ